jgi:NHL repeat
MEGHEQPNVVQGSGVSRAGSSRRDSDASPNDAAKRSGAVSSGLVRRPKGVVRLLIATAAATAALLALVATPASANIAHVFSSSFGASGSGDGQVSSPHGVAVNSTTHDVYVADTANARVDQFSSSGTFIRAFGADVGGVGVNVCTTGCVAGTSGSAAGQFTMPTFIAVDNSGGASAGDVYVGDTGDHLVSKFDASGNLITTWGSGGQLDGSTATHGPFGSLAGIAVENSGTLVVYNGSSGSRWFEFTQDGIFTTDFTDGFGTQNVGIAVDSGGNLYKVRGFGFVEKLDSSGNDLGTIDAADSSDTGLSVDPSTGDVYIDNAGTAIDRYAASSCHPTGGDQGGCAAAESFGSAQLSGGAGLATDSATGTVYVADATANHIDGYIVAIDATTGAATNVQTTTATLNGTVNPEGSPVSDCHFDYGTDTSYGQTAPCAETVGSGTTDVPVHADLSTLQGGTTYHFRLVAANAIGTARGDDHTLTTLPVPVIDSASASNLTPTAADLGAEINPKGVQLSDCHFEWGTDASYGHSVDCSPNAASISPDSSDHAVSAHLSGLVQNTTYHWRIIVANANGSSGAAVDHTFIYDTSGPGLPDGRAYEMVTPVQKNGTEFVPAAPVDIAADGSRVIATSDQCFADAGSCTPDRGQFDSPYAFTRTTAGWQATALSPPSTEIDHSTWLKYSADTGTALFNAPTAPGGEDDIYARAPSGSFADVGPVNPPALGPAVSLIPNPAFSADLSHFFYQLPGGVWPFDATIPHSGQNGLVQPSVMEYVGTGNAHPLLVGVTGGQGSTDLISICATGLGSLNNASQPFGRISADGRTAFFVAAGQDDTVCQPGTAVGSGANAGVVVPVDALYARIDGELPDAHTVAISQRSPSDCGVASGCQGSVPRDAFFVAASDDGSKAYFTDTQQLTDAAGQDPAGGDRASFGCHLTSAPNGCNLYLYDFSQPAGHELIDASAGDSSGGGPRVQGVLAVSQDGSHAYFVAKGVLTAQANAQGKAARDGADNVYLYERDAAHPDGRVAFIATLPASDDAQTSQTGALQWTGAFAGVDNVTSDGRYLVFLSRAQLTPDAAGSGGASQVYRYDAQTGALVRVSIGNDGFNDNGNAGAGDATIASGSVLVDRHPTSSEDGSYVFFRSPIALTPRALDDVQIGTDPTTSLPVYAQNVYSYHDGHVHLISDGKDTASLTGPRSDVVLYGADATGQNVFFSTSDQLVPQDGDTGVDLYDARVGGGFPFTPPPQPCSGDNCQPPPAGVPGVPTAASVTFSGPGNATPGAPTAKVRVLTQVVHGSTFLLKVSVPGKGRVTITGAAIRTVRKSVAGAGTYRLRVTLTAKAKKLLRHKRRLRLKLRVSYAPAGGASSSVTFSITDKA